MPVKEIIHHKHGAQVLEVPRAAQRDQSRWQENPRRWGKGRDSRRESYGQEVKLTSAEEGKSIV